MIAEQGPSCNEEERFSQLVSQYQRQLLHMCAMYLHDESTAEDAVQEELQLPAQEEASREEDREELAQAIMKLPRKYRDALLLYYYQDMNQEEVAQALNISPSTVSKRLKHARDKLRTLLERRREI